MNRDVDKLGEDWDIVGLSSFSPVRRHLASQRESLGVATPSNYSGETKLCCSTDSPAVQSRPYSRVLMFRRGSRGGCERGRGRGSSLSPTKQHIDLPPSAGVAISNNQTTLGNKSSSATISIPSNGFYGQPSLSPSPYSPQPQSPPLPLLHHLIAHQLHNGAFDPASPLPYSEMNIPAPLARHSLRLLTTAPNAAAYADVLEQLLTTAIVVLYLENKMKEEVDTWELVVEKARAWVEGVAEGAFLEDLWKIAGVAVRMWGEGSVCGSCGWFVGGWVGWAGNVIGGALVIVQD